MAASVPWYRRPAGGSQLAPVVPAAEEAPQPRSSPWRVSAASLNQRCRRTHLLSVSRRRSEPWQKAKSVCLAFISLHSGTISGQSAVNCACPTALIDAAQHAGRLSSRRACASDQLLPSARRRPAPVRSPPATPLLLAITWREWIQLVTLAVLLHHRPLGRRDVAIVTRSRFWGFGGDRHEISLSPPHPGPPTLAPADAFPFCVAAVLACWAGAK